MPVKEGTPDQKANWMEWIFKIASLLVIPLIGYVVTLESSIAVQNEKMATQSATIIEIKQEVKQIGDNKIALIRLEGELKTANAKLDDIKEALRRNQPNP